MTASPTTPCRRAFACRVLPAVALALLAGCALDAMFEGASAPVETMPGDARTATYDCPRQGEVTARIAPDVAALGIDGVWRVLPRTRSASGARFAAGGLLLWDRGATALISLDGPEEECERRSP